MEPDAYSSIPPKKNNTLLYVILAVCAGGICICGPIMAAILFPVFAQAKLAAQKTATVTNAKQHALGLIMYAADWGDHLPHDNWCDSSSEYNVNAQNRFSSKILQKGEETRYDFALTATLLAKSLQAVEDTRISIMTFESKNNEKNQVGGPELLPKPGRYFMSNGNRGSCASFADGHVKFILDDEFPDGLDDKGMFRVRQ
jgi:type II secretory pathway pseudopilin PulG